MFIRLLVASAAASITLFSVDPAAAQGNSTPATIYACLNPGNGLLRVVAATRGVLGVVTSSIALARGTQVPYFHLDLIAYSPLCLLLAALGASALILSPTSLAHVRRSTAPTTSG